MFLKKWLRKRKFFALLAEEQLRQNAVRG